MNIRLAFEPRPKCPQRVRAKLESGEYHIEMVLLEYKGIGDEFSARMFKESLGGAVASWQSKIEPQSQKRVPRPDELTKQPRFESAYSRIHGARADGSGLGGRRG